MDSLSHGRGWRTLLVLSMALSGAVPVLAAERELSQMSLEELMHEPVTSVAKRETRLSESPAAIAVITQDDIRRMGVTTLAEALRLAPGMDVGRITANSWAISSRGFNAQFARTVLVLVDGRSVYTANSAGVYWNAQDTLLEDVERIEVIRGPGATLWGANAVNGVVNIITKRAAQTQGGLVSIVTGTEDRPTVGARYGGGAGTGGNYRVYAKYFDRDGFDFADGQRAHDDWHTLRAGFRLDWKPAASQGDDFTLQGDWYDGEAGADVDIITLVPPARAPAHYAQDNHGANLLGRWTRSFSAASTLTLQSFAEHSRQGNGGPGGAYSDVYDLDLQHQFSWGSRYDLVWGAGFRYSESELVGDANVTWSPDYFAVRLFNVFVQQEIEIEPGLRLTLGSKFEHNSLDSWQVQPNIRVLWMPTAHQAAWAAISRATRTPSLFELGGRVNLAAFSTGPGNPPGLFALLPSWELRAEHLVAYEVGYRIAPTPRLALDVAAFVNRYDSLVQSIAVPPQPEPQPPPAHTLFAIMASNSGSGRTEGIEAAARWQVTDRWKLAGGYTWLRMTVEPDTTLRDDSPEHQFQLRSYFDVSPSVELNGAAYYVDAIEPQLGAVRVRVPAYVRLDVGMVWRLSDTVQVGIWGQNLLEDSHPEFGNFNKTLFTEVPRSMVAKVTWAR